MTMEVSTTPGETTVDTPSAVSMRTPERGSARSGTTTQGWRPISVKIQPDVQAAKGSHIVHSAAMPRCLSLTDLEWVLVLPWAWLPLVL